MKRTNTFIVRPLSDDGEQVLRNVLDASAALWNETNYQRRMRYSDEDGVKGDVWDADTGALEGKYKSVLGTSTAQQVINKNSEAWTGFFELKDQYHDDSNTSVTEHPSPPGFRGNKDDGRQLKTVIRTDAYLLNGEIDHGLKSSSGKSSVTNTIVRGPVFGWRLLAIRTGPSTSVRGRLDLWYDEADSTFRASQPVTVSDETQATPLADETAALDIVVNNLVACTTTAGEQYLYEGRTLFQRFRKTGQEIARLQA